MPRRSAGWPMTLTHTLAWRRSGVVSTFVIVANPIARIGDVASDDGADLLPQQLVDRGPFARGHGPRQLAARAADGLRGEALDDVAFLEVV